MSATDPQIQRGTRHDPADFAGTVIDCTKEVALPPVIVGDVAAGRDLAYRT
jgi:hypothetical protein